MEVVMMMMVANAGGRDPRDGFSGGLRRRNDGHDDSDDDGEGEKLEVAVFHGIWMDG